MKTQPLTEREKPSRWKSWIKPCLAFFIVCLIGSKASADAVVKHIKTMRDYNLFEIDGAPPERPLRFYIGENAAFAVCGHCLCATGIMKGRYPKLRIRPTSASPACKWGSPGIEADSPMLEIFLSMKRITATEGSLVFVDGNGREMRFLLESANLSPP